MGVNQNTENTGVVGSIRELNNTFKKKWGGKIPCPEGRLKYMYVLTRNNPGQGAKALSLEDKLYRIIFLKKMRRGPKKWQYKIQTGSCILALQDYNTSTAILKNVISGPTKQIYDAEYFDFVQNRHLFDNIL